MIEKKSNLILRRYNTLFQHFKSKIKLMSWEDNSSLQLLNRWWSSTFFCHLWNRMTLVEIWKGGISHMPLKKQFYKNVPCEPGTEVNKPILPLCCLGYSPKKDAQKWKLGKEKRLMRKQNVWLFGNGKGLWGWLPPSRNILCIIKYVYFHPLKLYWMSKEYFKIPNIILTNLRSTQC